MSLGQMPEVGLGSRAESEGTDTGVRIAKSKVACGIDGQGVVIGASPDQALSFLVREFRCQPKVGLLEGLISTRGFLSAFNQIAAKKELIGVVQRGLREAVIRATQESQHERQQNPACGKAECSVTDFALSGGGNHRPVAAKVAGSMVHLAGATAKLDGTEP